jgi:hypothetical protein
MGAIEGMKKSQGCALRQSPALIEIQNEGVSHLAT